MRNHTTCTLPIGILALVSIAVATPQSAEALVIVPTFDSSVTGLAKAAQVESAFDQTILTFESDFTDPVTVNINVSWGKVDGHPLSSNELGASWVYWWTSGSYSQTKAWLSAAATSAEDQTAIANLPAKSPAGNQFVIPYAEAKALGLRPANAPGFDGYVGFGFSPNSYTFNDSAGVASGTYDFQGIAKHEISEVLGRLSGLDTGTTPTYAYPFDLFRYTAPGSPNYHYGTKTYFSIDGGVTNLHKFNAGSGDQSDWNWGAGCTDAQAAGLDAGCVLPLSAADLTGLDIIGWDSSGASVLAENAITGAASASSVAAVPEPASLPLLGAALLGLVMWRKPWPTQRSA